MKHLVITLTVLSLVAAAVGFTAFHTAGDADVKAALEQRDAMAWLRTEFSLTDLQYQRIKTLHDSYSLECADHCRAIQEAEQTRDALKAAGADPARLAEANRTLQHLELVCETAIAAHVRRCAAEMSPAAAERYLALVLPKIADFDHRAPPDVGINPHRH